MAEPIVGRDLNPDGNTEPFRLGAYERIAQRSRLVERPTETFGLPLSTDIPINEDSAAEVRFPFNFSAKNAQPVLSLYEFFGQQCRLTIRKRRAQRVKARGREERIQHGDARAAVYCRLRSLGAVSLFCPALVARRRFLGVHHSSKRSSLQRLTSRIRSRAPPKLRLIC